MLLGVTAELGIRYGVDGFPYLIGLSGAAVGFAAGGAAFATQTSGPRRVAARSAVALGGAAAIPAALGLHYVVRGKLELRDRMLDLIDWSGAEDVADLGAGAGLLGIGAASRTTGRVCCVDLFVRTDLSGNRPERLLGNARRAGVSDRISILREDVRLLSLPDESVDVVLSTLCIHNIPDVAGRKQAISEAIRILKPGGTVVVSDLANVDDEYLPQLREAGLEVTALGRARGTFPPQRILLGTLPSPQA